MVNIAFAIPFTPVLNTTGSGLNGGKMYIGVANKDPQTNPLPVYWDRAGTIPAPQPLVINGGYIVNSGVPATPFLVGPCSVRVLDDTNKLIWFSPYVIIPDTSGNYTASGTATVTRSINSKLSERGLSAKDYGALCDGVHDDTAAINAMIADLTALNVKTGIIPGPTATITGQITLPSSKHIIFDGDINAMGMPANSKLFWGNFSSQNTITIQGTATGSLGCNFWHHTAGVNNRWQCNIIQTFKNAVYFESTGLGTGYNKVENRFYYNAILGCINGMYFAASSNGSGDVCEGFEGWGGFIAGCSQNGILIDAKVDMNYGYFTGAIDNAGAPCYVNNSTSGSQLNLKFITGNITGKSPTVIVSAYDELFSPSTGLLVNTPQSDVASLSLTVAHSNPQVAAHNPALGLRAGAAFHIAALPGSMTGVFFGTDPTLANANSCGGVVGNFTTGTTAGSNQAFGMQAIHRNGANTGSAPGMGLLFSRGEPNEIHTSYFFNGTTGNATFVAYETGDRINLPNIKTPTGSADVSGSVGDIAWDSGFIYVKTAVGAWKRVALTTF